MGDRAAHAARRRPPVFVLAVLTCLLVSGCATRSGAVKDAFGKSLQAVGLKPSPPTALELPLRLYAGANLNSGGGARAASLVVRVYQLRDARRFDEAALDVFLDEARERDVLGDDLIAVTEYLLVPGKRHEVVESLPADGSRLGVVALFQVPAPTRWRFTFNAPQAIAEGVTIGLHRCAMTTASNALTTRLSTPAHSLSASQCSPARR